MCVGLVLQIRITPGRGLNSIINGDSSVKINFSCKVHLILVGGDQPLNVYVNAFLTGLLCVLRCLSEQRSLERM